MEDDFLLRLPVELLEMVLDRLGEFYDNDSVSSLKSMAVMDDAVSVARTCRQFAAVVEAWFLKVYNREDEHGIALPSPLYSLRTVSRFAAGYLRWHPQILRHHQVVLRGVVWCSQGVSCQLHCGPLSS